MKPCVMCREVLPLDAYHADKSKKDGRVSYCKSCAKVKRAKYYVENAERLKKHSKEYIERLDPFSLEAYRQGRREYHKARIKDLASRRQYHANKYSSDISYRMGHCLRSLLKRSLRLSGASKDHPTFDTLGYTTSRLIARMEAQFKPGMSWDNYGEWEIDHKIPLMVMLRRGECRPHVVNALSNLQPMWKFDNRSKGARRVG